MRGRKPTPTHLKLVRGNPGRRPLNRAEPKPAAGMPTAPAHLSTEAKTEWRRVAPELYRLGILTRLDRSALAAYCQCYGRWRQAEEAITTLTTQAANGYLVQHALIGIANKAMAI
jgi:phage terminase small subunit